MKKRAYEAARDLGISNREFLARARATGADVPSFTTMVDEELMKKVRAGMDQPADLSLAPVSTHWSGRVR